MPTAKKDLTVAQLTELIGRSKLDVKTAILKPISSAISIGTGGPFGAEGPIIMTGGAIGSLFAQRFRLSAAERKERDARKDEIKRNREEPITEDMTDAEILSRMADKATTDPALRKAYMKSGKVVRG